MGEREAAHEHGAGGRRPARILGRIVGERRPPSSRACAATSAKRPGPRASSVSGLAEAREHEAVAVGLLEAGRSGRRAGGRQNCSTRSSSAGIGTVIAASDAGAAAPRAAARRGDPLAEPLDGRHRQCEAIVSGLYAKAHVPTAWRKSVDCPVLGTV